MQIKKLNDIVENKLCLGCGLCQSIVGKDKIKILMTKEGCLEPIEIKKINNKSFNLILKTCPGIKVSGLPKKLVNNKTKNDLIWGSYLELYYTYAKNKNIRYISSTGGLLNALAIYLLETKKITSIIHTSASKKNPMRSVFRISKTKEEVMDSTSSRYGPAPSLEKIMEILDKNESFAFIGKPCDISAIRNLEKIDQRIKKQCKFLLTIVCGGIPKLSKSKEALKQFKIKEKDLRLFRYRGHGNPGDLTIKTKNNKVYKSGYNEFWEDESKWRVLFRCKICPDAIGESADIVALDVWPNALPKGNDNGFNGVIVRTSKGKKLIDKAIKQNYLVKGKKFKIKDLNNFQPHQVNKKKSVYSRLKGLTSINKPIPTINKLRIKKISKTNDREFNNKEYNGVIKRRINI